MKKKINNMEVVLPNLQLLYNNKTIGLILRSGSDINIISTSFARTLGMYIRPLSMDTKKTLGSKLPHDACGEVFTKFRHSNGLNFQFSSIVVEEHMYNVTAGMPFLIDNGITIDMRQREIIVQSMVIPYGTLSVTDTSQLSVPSEILSHDTRSQCLYSSPQCDYSRTNDEFTPNHSFQTKNEFLNKFHSQFHSLNSDRCIDYEEYSDYEGYEKYHDNMEDGRYFYEDLHHVNGSPNTYYDHGHRAP